MSDLTLLKEAITKQLSRSTKRRFAVLDFDNTCIINDIGEATFAFACENRLIKNGEETIGQLLDKNKAKIKEVKRYSI